MVEQPVRDAGLLGDVADPGGVIPVPGEDTHGGVEDQPALVLRRPLGGD